VQETERMHHKMSCFTLLPLEDLSIYSLLDVLRADCAKWTFGSAEYSVLQ